ncbi:alkene reductase [Streptomyces sp. MAR4 CNX-425]|uniref:alkene reductase n=1 Tax=Streptomyces sp. MAR4 CNX-425 TaxID=3406343 RepID=UPI003B515433
MTNELFAPVRVGRLDLPHRLAMAPMTRSRATADTGLVSALTAEYYEQRAGAALIVTEGTQPSVRAQGYIQTPGIHTAAQVAAWRQVTDRVHAAGGTAHAGGHGGGRIFMQLLHSGRVGHPYLYPDGGLPEAPSAVASGESLFTVDRGMLPHPVPRELTAADIGEIVRDFAAGARNAIEAGFDGVELHGANGYLIHQFLSANSNLRTDAYGGPAENRIRFAVEAVRAVTEAIGADRTALRISPGNDANGVAETDTAELYAALLAALAPYPLAYLHTLEAHPGLRPVTEQVRRDWAGPLVLNSAHHGGGDPVADAERLIAAGTADVVALGERWLANPDLLDRARAGGPYNEADPATYYGGDHRGYTDYPALAPLAPTAG